ncbi:hypothetical protein GUJ93_ZPchr0008g13912 [Zizania palustris]|uniref:EF-hand domain-containing protein n=1 Tax=Zizania palustris TaxID=103762 RepID=A0A8J5RDV6_ZIZPA|nr:hypothetical protein GUJ93_ZPchr0008g13912 [Zizania palustris]
MGSGDGMKELIEKLAAKIDDLKTSINKLVPLARVAEQLATLPSKVVALQSSAFENQEQGFLQEMSQKDEKIKSIVSMGFPKDEAKMAITREEEEVKNAKVEHDRKEQLCSISQALVVLASASSVTKERQEFLKLVNKEIELYNTMLEKEGTEDEEETRRAYMAAREESDHVAELLDSDRDGKVTPEEVATSSNYLKDTIGKDGVQELISNLSKDKEGKILVEVLVDSIYALETAGNAYSANLSDYEDTESISFGRKKTKFMEGSQKKRKRYGSGSQGNPVPLDGIHEEPIPLSNPMVGFSLPSDKVRPVHRTLPDQAFGPPFFYYENVARAPKGVWTTISRFLYDIQPEFVDSKFFCAAARKRGYIHNLPIENRSPVLPLPPKTIYEAFPSTKMWWPSWGPRRQFNCLQTCVASAKLTERIRCSLSNWGDTPSPGVQKCVLDECRKWNLVWVGKNKVAPLEPDEMEFLLGYPRNHTRGVSRIERYRALGNSFQVDTVAYHLSVLRNMFPNGMNVLSLFSGIGGAGAHLPTVDKAMKDRDEFLAEPMGLASSFAPGTSLPASSGSQ